LRIHVPLVKVQENMRTSSNGAAGNGHVRRYRLDGRDETPGTPALGHTHSGRLLILCGLAVLLVLWGVLLLIFREWRAQYRALAKYGATQVAPTVDVLVDQAPPGVNPREWQKAVADTRAMLVVVTSSGQLDRATMEQLRRDLTARFAETVPNTAIRELTRLWDEMEAKAGPILTREPTRAPFPPKRPKLFPRPEPTKAEQNAVVPKASNAGRPGS
jgi:hypothetical protein